MNRQATNEEDEVVLALAALGWVLTDSDRAGRLLAMTGLAPAELRAGAGEPATLAAVLAWIEGHEADLVACAEAIGARPESLVAARHRLEA